MPRILGLLGLIATVMHIALGCCVHAGHEGEASHDHGHHVLATSCVCHDHHHHDAEPTPVVALDGEQVSAPAAALHVCDDEHCTSTLTLKVTFDGTLHSGVLVALLPPPAEVVARPQLSFHLDIDPHAFTRLRAHALCARFLI